MENQTLLPTSARSGVRDYGSLTIALERGDAAAAAAGSAHYLRLLGGATTERAPGLELLAEAQAAAGRAAEAAVAATELEAIAQGACTDPPLGAARHAQGDLDEKDLESLAEFNERRFASGETIALKGAGGAMFFVVESGEASVEVHGEEVSSLGPGDSFGEVAWRLLETMADRLEAAESRA